MVKIGVYLCRCGGNISDIIDLKDVEDSVKGMVEVVNTQDYLCSSAGQERIKRDIEKGRINRVVICACSPKLHLETFKNMARESGLNPSLLEIVNIREQASWVHLDRDEANRKVKALILGSIEGMLLVEPLEPITKDLLNSILVVGGGIAGITAALETTDEYKVTLIEREPWLGGHMIGLSKTFPTLDCSQCILTPKMVAVRNHKNIKMFTQTEVQEIKGSPGDYTVTLIHHPRYVDIEKCINCGACAKKCPSNAIYLPFAQAIPQAYLIEREKCNKCGACMQVCPREAINIEAKEEETSIRVGSIVLATGFEPLDPSKIEEYNYHHPDVLTSIEFEEMLSAKSKTNMRLQKSDGSFPNRVAFVLCVGSRDYSGKGSRYCSKVCCLYSLKQAQLVKKMRGEAEAWIFYIDMRASGRRFEEFYHHTQEIGVQFVRGRVAEIIPEKKGLMVHYEDTLLGRKGKERFDMVVLCPSLLPSKGTRELADKLGVPIGEDGFIEEKHVKLDPVDTFNQAVFSAGCALGPKDIHDAVTEGIGAAHKAAQFLRPGRIIISPEKPEILNCNGCKACVEACPYQALSLENNRAVLDPFACMGCGICVPVCSIKGIEIKNYTREMLKARIAGILSLGPGILAFVDPFASAAADIAGVNRKPYSEDIRFINLPSIHMLDSEVLNFAFERGATGILLIEGTQDEKLTSRSSDLYKGLKKATRKHKKPLRYSHVETAQYEKLVELLNVFTQQAQAKTEKGEEAEEKKISQALATP